MMIKRIRIRTMFIGGCITILFFILLVRIFWVQVVDASFLTEKAKETWSTTVKLDAVRGTIFDRNMNTLAVDAPAYTVAVNPKRIHDLKLEEPIAAKLSEILNKPLPEVLALVTAKKKDGTYYDQREVREEGWKIDQDLADMINTYIDELRDKVGKNADVGIYMMKETKRFYPNDSLASHLLGYTDKQGKAVTGLEAFFDKDLAGTDGSISYDQDRKGYKLPSADEIYKPEKDGKNLVLTLDQNIQHFTEEALKEVYNKYQPISATAIVADPSTMDILATASMPNYNPNKYWETKNQKNFYDHSIKSVYEPGSTFKIITLAAAVQEGLFNPNETYKSGTIKVGGWPIRDHKRGGWGEITFLEGLKRSSNVAFVKLGYERLQKDRLEKYLEDFGFGQKTGMPLFGEQAGLLRLDSNAAVATASFGQGSVAVTPIQQVAGVAAVANGGKLMAPRLVKEIIDPTTNTTTKIEPTMVRQVISPETSRKVGEYLEQVVSDQKIGTGKSAYIEGYRIAGKTGTAQKPKKGGGYEANKYVVSFIGYAPVEDPKLLVYVIIDEPNDQYVGGGSAAGPVFKSIMSQSLRYLGIEPSSKPKQETEDETKSEGKAAKPVVIVPDVLKLKSSEAKEKLTNQGITFDTIGKGSTIVRQVPDAGTPLAQGNRVYLITEDPKNITMPDMKGSSLRDVLEFCSLLDISYTITGEGYVVSQETTKDGDNMHVNFKLEPMKGAPSDPPPK
ncbi:penicillin-binding transpeptidase domain-containing protein [Paenibacillus terrigena]|uniref:penicillin-binding protein n=1 Tax=Paenibacillus terrigena TaxID=369333 RepID=UPI0028D47EBD|nr:penicillin-binding transpeptidase domain-containing protein [Paenibacillus terrigena]